MLFGSKQIPGNTSTVTASRSSELLIPLMKLSCVKANRNNICVKVIGLTLCVVDVLSGSNPGRRVMKAMTKEEWERQQSKVRHVYDPETGRQR